MIRTSRGRPRAFDKDETLEKAMFLFWDRGFEGASLDDLTATMGISPSSLYSAYGGKEKLYFAALDRFLATRGNFWASILDEPGIPTREAFRRLFSTAAFELLRSDQPAGCMLAIAGTHMGPGAAKIREGIRERRQRVMESFANRVERGKQEGDLPPDTDVASLAHYLFAVYQGLATQARDGVDRPTLLAIGRNATTCFPKATGGGGTGRMPDPPQQQQQPEPQESKQQDLEDGLPPQQQHRDAAA
ncbi:TetR family transcriptional regulator [Bryobacterales bacterium F-183]|nr:TetR family transcriptional regulator [Bryobacterales bacterium F-183]